MDPSSAQQLEAAFLAILGADDGARHAAETAIGQYISDPNSMSGLLFILQNSQHVEARQLCAVVMRRRITGHWVSLSPDARATIQRGLLTMLTSESSPLLVSSIQSVIAVIAKIVLSSNGWPDLLPFLFQAVQSENPKYREMALKTFAIVADDAGLVMRSVFPQLFQAIAAGLTDSNNEIKVSAIDAMASVMQWIETKEEEGWVHQSVPTLARLLAEFVESGDEDTCVKLFEIFDMMIEATSSLIAKNIPELIKFMMQIAANTTIGDSMRQRSLDLVMWTCKYKPKAIVRHGLLPIIVRTVFPMMAEPLEEDEDELKGGPGAATGYIADSVELTNHTAAVQLVDYLALSIPDKYLMDSILPITDQYLMSQNPYERKAGLSALLVLAEGASELLKKRLDDVLRYVLSMLQNDTVGFVKAQAGACLGQFSQFLQPEIIAYHDKILPIVFSVIDYPSPSVQEKCIYALEAFCENLGDGILPYMETLMQRLVSLVTASSDRGVLEIAIAAISSVAVAAGQDFLPYSEQVLNMCDAFVVLDSPDDLVLRARATECIGVVGNAIGAQHFGPFVEKYLQIVINGCAIDSNEIREYSFNFFANCAAALQTRFSQYIPVVLPLVIASCESNDSFNPGGVSAGPSGAGGVSGASAGVSVSGEQPSSLFDSDAEEDSDSDDEFGDGGHIVRTSFLEEKAAAVTCLGRIALHVGRDFYPYIPASLKCVQTMALYFHDTVKNFNHITALYVLIAAGKGTGLDIDISEGAIDGEDAVKSVWFAQFSELPEAVRLVAEPIIKIWSDSIGLDYSREVVGRACEAMNKALAVFGPSILEPVAEPIMKVLIKVFREKAPCQMDDEDHIRERERAEREREGQGQIDRQNPDEEDESDVLDDHDQILIDEAGDLIGKFASHYPSLFFTQKKYGQKLWKAVHRFLKKDRDVKDRVMAFGVCAEIMEGLKAAVPVDWLSALWQYIDRDMTPPSDTSGVGVGVGVHGVRELMHNATFCSGIVAETGAAIASTNPSVGNLLIDIAIRTKNKLVPLFNEAFEGTVKDNAVGALSRVMAAIALLPPAAQAQIITPSDFLKLVLPMLPTIHDDKENEPIFKCIGVLWEHHQSIFVEVPIATLLLAAFARSLQFVHLPVQSRAMVAGLLSKFVRGEASSQVFSAALAQLGENDKAIITSIINS